METWMWIGLAGGGLWLILALYWGCRRRLTDEHIAALLMLAGFLLRLMYVLYTPVTVRQHDVYRFDAGKGHAGYIFYFYEHGRLPDFAPNSVSQFYHPPLHHILEALWMRLQTGLRVSLAAAEENTQLLTLLYSALCMPVINGIFTEAQLRGRARRIPLAIICFHPTFILMAGSINNDILMTLLTLTAFWMALRWYRRPSMGRILLTALAMGCAMMTKFSASLAAPAIGLLFLLRLASDLQQNDRPVRRRLWCRYLGQFAAFALLCCPLGLWWTVYSALVWQVPPGYVPSLSLTSHQYVGMYPVWRRLLITGDQLSSVYVAWGDLPGHSYYEYNIFTGLLKTSVFDESTLFTATGTLGRLGYGFSVLLFICNIGLIGMAVIAAVLCLHCRRRIVDTSVTASIVCLGAVVLLSYISFCFGYPHTCTQNFRYAVPTLLTGCLFLGRWLLSQTESRPTRLGRIAAGWTEALTALFCISSAAVYGLLGLV